MNRLDEPPVRSNLTFTFVEVMKWAARNGWPKRINLSPNKWTLMLYVAMAQHYPPTVEKGVLIFVGMEFVYCTVGDDLIPELEEMQ